MPTDSASASPCYDSRTNLLLMVRRLGESADTLRARLRPVASLPLQAISSTMKVPWNQPTPEAIAAARRMIADHRPIFKDEAGTSIGWDWVFALRDLDKVHKLQANPHYDLEIQVLRIGDLIIVGWPGEPFVEAQLEVKLKAHPRLVIVAHECNDECGYMPTLNATQRGGYEAWGKMPPGTLERMAEQTVEMIAGL